MKEYHEQVEEVVEIVDHKSQNKFAKGVITGVLSTVCIFLVLGAGAIFWLQGRISMGIGMGSQGASTSIVTNTVRAKINELSAVIQKNYYEDVDTQDLTDGLYKGLFASLGDPYSAYYTEEEYQEMMISASAQYYGIGAVLQQDVKSMRVQIIRIYDDTPAMKAGLKAGDNVIMEIGRAHV